MKQFKADYLEAASWKKWFFSFFIEQPREYKGRVKQPGIKELDVKPASPKKRAGKQLVEQNKIASDNARKLLENMKKVKYDDDDFAVEVFNYRKKLVNFAGEKRSLQNKLCLK